MTSTNKLAATAREKLERMKSQVSSLAGALRRYESAVRAVDADSLFGFATKSTGKLENTLTVATAELEREVAR